MPIMKTCIPRRRVLQGLGASVALPLLDAMVPAGTALAHTPAAARPRLGFIYFPHGAIMDQWTPQGARRDFALPPILAPLAPHKQRISVVSGLENRHAEGAVHATTPGTWLSSVTPQPGAACAGITADQVAALHLGRETRLPSLELAVEEGGPADPAHPGHGASLSFRDATGARRMQSDPRKLLCRLFGEGLPRGAAASLLDGVGVQAADLKKTLGRADRARLDDYFESLRSIERRIARQEAASAAGRPVGMGQRLDLTFDLMALAFEADLTRVQSVMMAAEASDARYEEAGVADAFHALSHHQNNADRLARLARIQTFHTRAFARFLDRLAATPDGDGSLLDHALLLYGSNMSDSNRHDHFPLPLVVAGGGAGRLQGGRHVIVPARTPMANLTLTLLDRARVPAWSVGDSNGEIADI